MFDRLKKLHWSVPVSSKVVCHLGTREQAGQDDAQQRTVTKERKLTTTPQNTYLEREQRRKRKTRADPVPGPCGGASWTPPGAGSALPASVSYTALRSENMGLAEKRRGRESRGKTSTPAWERSWDWRARADADAYSSPPRHPGFRRVSLSPDREIRELALAHAARAAHNIPAFFKVLQHWRRPRWFIHLFIFKKGEKKPLFIPQLVFSVKNNIQLKVMRQTSNGNEDDNDSRPTWTVNTLKMDEREHLGTNLALFVLRLQVSRNKLFEFQCLLCAALGMPTLTNTDFFRADVTNKGTGPIPISVKSICSAWRTKTLCFWTLQIGFPAVFIVVVDT